MRIDCDWDSGLGDYYAVNLDKGRDIEGFYTERELNSSIVDKPDIDVYYCRICDTFFEI